MHRNDTPLLWQRILDAASSRGMLQKDLARAAGMDPARLSLLKTTFRTPKPDEMAGLARAIGTTPEALTGELTLPPPPMPNVRHWTRDEETTVCNAYRRLMKRGDEISVDWLRRVGKKIDRSPGAIAVRLHRARLISSESAAAWQSAVVADHARERRKSGHRPASAVVRARDGGTCVLCAATEDLHVHHIVPFHVSKVSTPEEMATLCKLCHKRIHRGLPADEVDAVAAALSRATGTSWRATNCGGCGHTHLGRTEDDT